MTPSNRFDPAAVLDLRDQARPKLTRVPLRHPPRIAEASTSREASIPARLRGAEYLRIIYGPEYSAPEHLKRLRARGLSVKRSLALREFALGLEALHRFVDGEPLYRVHECVFGVLALESEPVDPRL